MDFQIWTGTHLVSTTPAVLESTDAGAVVIPQKCAEKEAALVISYDLKKYLGTGTDEWLRAQTVTLPLTAGTDGEAWLPGKKYVYTIVFGDNEIRIAPSVTYFVKNLELALEGDYTVVGYGDLALDGNTKALRDVANLRACLMVRYRF